MKYPRRMTAAASLALLSALAVTVTADVGVVVGHTAGQAVSSGNAQPTGTPAPATETLSTLVSTFGGAKAVTRPSRDAIMGFPLPTRILEVAAKGGQNVTRDQLLVRGDDAEDLVVLRLQELRARSRAPVEKATKAAALALLELKRLEEARTNSGATDQEVDRARLTSESAAIDVEIAQVSQTQEELQVSRLQSRIDKLRIVAPFDGTVESVLVDVGQSVSEQDKAVRVVQVDPLWIDVPARTDQTVTLGLKVGDAAWVLVEQGGRPEVKQGKVIEVSPVAEAASRTRRVRVEVKNPEGPGRVVAGEPAWVRFSAPETEWEARARRLAHTEKPGS